MSIELANLQLQLTNQIFNINLQFKVINQMGSQIIKENRMRVEDAPNLIATDGRLTGMTMKRHNPDNFIFNGSAKLLQDCLNEITPQQINQIVNASIIVQGTEIHPMNNCRYICTIILGSVLILPLFCMLCDWWKKWVYPAFEIPLSAYHSLGKLFNSVSLKSVTLQILDNTFDANKAKFICQMVSQGRIEEFTFINRAGNWNYNNNEYSNFSQNMRQIKHINTVIFDVRWGKQIVLRSEINSKKQVIKEIKTQNKPIGIQTRNRQAPSKISANRPILKGREIVQLDSLTALQPQERELSKLIKKQSQESLKKQIPSVKSQSSSSDVKIWEQHLEARDRHTLLQYKFKQKHYNIQRQKSRLNQWLGEMHFKVVSSSFNLFLSNQLTFEEVKMHCCQNLLLNILIFLQNLTQNQQNDKENRIYTQNRLRHGKIKVMPLGYLQLTQILKEVNTTLINNLAYMQIKYPLTKDTKPNKSLQSLISKINNLGNDEHDMVMKSGVNFKLKHEDNYTPEIMRFLNCLISRQSESCKLKGKNNKQLSYFQYFYQTIQSLFTSIYTPQYETKQKMQRQSQQIKLQDSLPIKIQKTFAQIAGDDNQKQILSKEAKQYKEKVMKYTHFKIGRKLSSNTQMYSQKQILTQIFDVRNSSILRILTKWTQQLQNKILNCQQDILKRPFRFKKNKAFQYSKLSANQKNDLYLQTKRRIKDVNLFNQELKQNYNQIQAMLCSHLGQGESTKNIPKKEYKVGYFCTKMQVAASSTLISYLNKMIHILLMIPQQLKKTHAHDEQYVQNMDINLVTFKIADLFRCKIKSRQAQIIRILKQIKRISEKGQPFKIVRIKDRLNLGTRDILINVLFMNIFLCQIQLAVEQYVDEKQLSYDSFSHFLYELHRSRLGPVMQSACTWAQFDQRSKIYRSLPSDKSRQIIKYVSHSCSRQYMVKNKYPFVCSLCEIFYSTQEGLLQHLKCMQCRKYFECSQCIYNKMNPMQIAELIHLHQKLGFFLNDFALWNAVDRSAVSFPRFGLLTSKKMKKPDIIFFQTIIFKFDAYIIKISQDKTQSDNASVQIIQKILGNSSKGWKLFSQKYIVYDWKEKRSINKTITPEIMLKAMQSQKLIKDEGAKTKKEQKQRKRIELQKRRKQKQDDDQQDIVSIKKMGNDNEDNQQLPLRHSKKQVQNKNRNIIYHEGIAKKNQTLKVRVIQRQTQSNLDILVLGIYLKQSVIRNKLKQMKNKTILQRISLQKIEVLFFEDQYIHDQLNYDDSLTQFQRNELKQTAERVSQVYFDNNFIQCIDFLEKMINLKVVHLSHNNIQNLQPLEHLMHLTELILQNNKISSLQGLKNKPDLLEINLNRNQLKNLLFFQELQEGDYNNLKNLYLNANQIQNLKGLQKLTSLVKLDLSYNAIKTIGSIKSLLHLQELDLSCNKIKDIKNIKQFGNLKKLYLNQNKIKNIPPTMQQLFVLNILDISSNKLTKIQYLNTGPISKSLKQLNLSNNIIKKMEGLDGMENLQILNLSNNQIQTIDNYLDLNSLIKLQLNHNCLQKIHLQDTEKYLSNLNFLYLSSNPIKDNLYNRSVLATLTHIHNIQISMTLDDNQQINQ